MNTLGRWKLACALLCAIATSATWVAWQRSGRSAAAEPSRASAGALPAKMFRALRVPAEAVGLSEQDLIDRVLSSHSTREIAILTEKLGAVGTDDAVQMLRGLVDDRRRGIAELIVAMMGAIGTESAVDLLLATTKDQRPSVRSSAVRALGASQSARAESYLLALAQKPADPDQSVAIGALALLQSDAALAAMLKLVESTDLQTANAAIWALSSMSTPSASAAIRTLIDSPNPRLATSAIGALDEIDEALARKLVALARTANIDIASAALGALSRAPSAVGMPVLREMATQGPQQLRWNAIQALGEMADESSLATLGDILRTGDRQSAAAAAQALGASGSPAAREYIIEAALSDRAEWTGAIYQLGTMQGEDVDAALVDVVKNGSARERQVVMPRLLRLGNAEAMRVAIEQASTGSRSDQMDAMRQLADAGTPQARQALITIADQTKGQSRVNALEMLAQINPSDPRIGKSLSESLFSGRKSEAANAATVLGRLGTEASQRALITAMNGGDKDVALAAARALGQQGMTESVKAMMLGAARNGDSQMRGAILDKLLEQGAPEGLRLAEEVLASKDPAVAQGAVYALSQAGTPKARMLIEQSLSAQDPGVRTAAIQALAQTPTDSAADSLIRMAKDSDSSVRSAAMTALAQIGTEKATQTLIDSARQGSAENRVAALSGLSMLNDSKATKAIVEMMHDKDETVAQTAISSTYNGGAEIDTALISLINNGAVSEALRLAAANQLRNRNADLDEATEKRVTALAGSANMYGGYSYGGYVH